MSKKKIVKSTKEGSKKIHKTTRTKSKSVKNTTKKTSKKISKKGIKSSGVTKKVSAKKTVKALVCAKDGECFWTTDGSVLRDLDQLQLAFGSMKDEVFLHHVTTEKNDFADWVDTVLEDSDCAHALRKSRKPSSARNVVLRHVRMYRI